MVPTTSASSLDPKATSTLPLHQKRTYSERCIEQIKPENIKRLEKDSKFYINIATATAVACIFFAVSAIYVVIKRADTWQNVAGKALTASQFIPPLGLIVVNQCISWKATSDQLADKAQELNRVKQAWNNLSKVSPQQIKSEFQTKLGIELEITDDAKTSTTLLLAFWGLFEHQMKTSNDLKEKALIEVRNLKERKLAALNPNPTPQEKETNSKAVEDSDIFEQQQSVLQHQKDALMKKVESAFCLAAIQAPAPESITELGTFTTLSPTKRAVGLAAEPKDQTPNNLFTFKENTANPFTFDEVEGSTAKKLSERILEVLNKQKTT